MRKIFSSILAGFLFAAFSVFGAETPSTDLSSSSPKRAPIRPQPGSIDDLSATPKPDAAPAISGQKEGPLDRALSKKVRTALAAKDSADTTATGPSTRSDLQVSSFHGVVTLRGKVNSQAEKQALVDKVQSMGGVTIVKNELQVTSPPTVSEGTPGKQGTDSESKKERQFREPLGHEDKPHLK